MSLHSVTENVCVVTTHGVPSALGGGGSSHSTNDVAQIIDPQTGNILSVSGGGGMLKVGSDVGVYSLSRIPRVGNPDGSEVYIATCGKSKDDMSAHLVVQGCTSSPRWKCRLPESMDGGILVSPCGNYIVGAAKSGNCYCWSTFQEGELLRIWAAHYRPIQSMVFSDCGSYLITGGADGILNAWSLMHIVSQEYESTAAAAAAAASQTQYSGKRRETLSPVKTWSEHPLPITHLHALPSSRIVSTSMDRNVVIVELFSGRTLAKIHMPCAIQVVTADSRGSRLYLGSLDGTIYCIDVDAYAIAATAEGAKVIQNYHNSNQLDDRGPSYSGSLLEETILGMESVSSSSGSSYTSELRGHEGAVTCLALLEENGYDLLASGGMDGSVRFWDLRSRCCMKTVYPWSSSTLTSSLTGVDGEPKNPAYHCPCSNIIVIPRSSIESKGGMNVFTTTTTDGQRSDKMRGGNGMKHFKPLQRFPKEKTHDSDNSGYITHLIPSHGFGNDIASTLAMVGGTTRYGTRTKKAKHHHCNNADTQGTSPNGASLLAENEQLRQELANAKEMIERWQKVNHKLALKLKNATS